MKQTDNFPIKLVLLGLIWVAWWWALTAPLTATLNLAVIVGGVLLVYPSVWLGRKFLDREPTPSRAAQVTTLVHFSLGFSLGVPLLRALVTYQDWLGWQLPIPSGIGLALVLLTGAAFLLVVLNLALKGLGAPFFIALSQKLAIDWLYAWTRNPMVLAGLAWLLAAGIWFQSTLFIGWAALLFAPALLFFVKVFEERELELRFGASYLAYKAKTPILWPRRPKA